MKSLSHIQYIIDNYSSALLVRLQEEGYHLTFKDALDILLSCDPTEGKRLTDWLVKTYTNGGFLWEDVEAEFDSKVAELLQDYKKHFSNIPRDKRNIYQYKTYGELYRLVEPYLVKEEEDSSLSGRRIKKMEREKALGESMVLYRSEEMIVAVPLTEKASCWWGRGTKWCTAAEKNNYFSRYNKNAPLIVINILDESSRKFQLWATESFIYFMDEADAELKIETIKDYWNLLKPSIEWAVEQNGRALKYVPEEFITDKLCKAAVQQDGLAIEFVPNKHRTLELIKSSIEKNGTAIELIPEEYVTRELCEMALDQDGWAIQYISNNIKTYDLYKKAVKQNGLTLEEVPVKHQTDEIFKLAVEQNGEALQWVPIESITDEICKLAVRSGGAALRLVPTELITDEICKLAVVKNGTAIIYIPKKLITPELCKLAVISDGAAIAYVPKELINVELCNIAVDRHDRNRTFLNNIPETLRSFELCRLAIERSWVALKFVPANMVTDELCRLAVKQHRIALDYVPSHLMSDELSVLAGSTDLIEIKWNLSILDSLQEKLKVESLDFMPDNRILSIS